MRGFISAQIGSATGIDEETGMPIGQGDISFSKDYECNYYPNTLNNKGVYSGGKFQQSEYEITVYDMSFRASIIRLKDNKGNVIISDKEVKSLLVLDSIQRVKIIV